MIRVQVANPTAEQLREQQMVPICCDEFERSLEAGILDQARGLVYVRQGPALWRIHFCPFCADAIGEHEVERLPEELAAAPAEEPYHLETLGPRQRRNRCIICDKKGHRASTCPKKEKPYR